MNITQEAYDAIEEWLTVKEFAARYNMEPRSVYEAIRKGRLNFEVRRMTTGKRGTVRIGPPKAQPCGILAAS